MHRGGCAQPASRRPPRVWACVQDKEALSATLRARGSWAPTDQFDPGLNKEKCIWIRQWVVSVCSRPALASPPSTPGAARPPSGVPRVSTAGVRLWVGATAPASGLCSLKATCRLPWRRRLCRRGQGSAGRDMWAVASLPTNGCWQCGHGAPSCQCSATWRPVLQPGAAAGTCFIPQMS